MKKEEIKELKIYKRTFARLRSKSKILNDLPPQHFNEFGFRPTDRHNLEINKVMILGDGETGKFVLNKTTHFAKVPAIEKALTNLEKDYKERQQRGMNEGREPMETYPSDLLEKAATLIAERDVYKLEVEKIDKCLDEVEEIAPERSPILKTLGVSKLRHGIMVVVDGQDVKVNKDGVLAISDERSPFDGLLVWKYIAKVVKAVAHEQQYRQRIADKQAQSEFVVNRQPAQVRPNTKSVGRPTLPSYNKKTDTISYPSDYSEKTITKFK